MRLLERPSWLTLVPCTTSACACSGAAASSRALKASSRCTTHASARAYPSPRESSVLQRPSCGRQPATEGARRASKRRILCASMT